MSYCKKYLSIFSVFLISTSLSAQNFADKTPMYRHLGYSTNVEAGDINGDGYPDIITGSWSRDKIFTMFNDGDGNFETVNEIIEIDSPIAKLFDFDADGDLDILAISYMDDDVYWIENNGDGTFLPNQIHVIYSNLQNPTDASFADMNGDGDMDLILHHTYSSEVLITYGDGEGNFSSVVNFDPVGGLRSFAVGDLDDDGDIDFLCTQNNQVSWYENLNNTGFDTMVVINNNIVENYITQVDLMDFDEDGDDDIIYGALTYVNGYLGPSELGIIESNGDGTFVDRIVLANDQCNSGEIISLDMDGDGDLDFISTSQIYNEIYWYENQQCSNFEEHIIPSNLSDYTSVASADFNGDGKIDFITNGRNSTSAIFISEGNGNFDRTMLSRNGGTNIPVALHLTDMDADGDLDMVSTSLDLTNTSISEQKIAWYKNDGKNTFGHQRLISTTTDSAVAISSADFDNDGDMDIVAACASDNSILLYKQQGNANFGTPITISSNTIDPTAVFAADLSGDGNADILSASYEDQKIAWYKNDGNGGFGNQNVLTTSADGAQVVLAADLDNDSDLDVLYASINDHTVAWFKNNGNDMFSNENFISNQDTYVNSVDVFDVEMDGDLDIITCSVLNGYILWYENDGAGNFSTADTIAENGEFGMVSLYDLDADGDKDILVTDIFQNDIHWIENTDSGTFSGLKTIADDIPAPKHILAVDVNNDGDLDVVTSAFSGDEIYISENLLHSQEIVTFTVCDSLLSPDGTSYYTSSGTYIDTFINSFNGDSIITTQLEILDADTQILSHYLCYGDTFYIADTSYMEAGYYSHNYLNECGKDSIVILDLTLSHTDSIVLVDTVCSSQCFKVGNTYYSVTGDYIDTLYNQCGFDSIVYSSVVFLESSVISITEGFCQGDTIFIGNEYFTTSGDYEVVLENMMGCDSVVYLELTVSNVNASVNVNGTNLSAISLSGNSYQWLDCNDDFSPIPGATTSFYSPTQSGSYAVKVSQSGCIKTSTCNVVNIVGLEEWNVSAMTLSPNPTMDKIDIQFNNKVEEGTLVVSDLVGRNYISKTIRNESHCSISLAELPAGVYMVSCFIDNQKILVDKVVKQ